MTDCSNPAALLVQHAKQHANYITRQNWRKSISSVRRASASGCYGNRRAKKNGKRRDKYKSQGGNTNRRQVDFHRSSCEILDNAQVLQDAKEVANVLFQLGMGLLCELNSLRHCGASQNAVLEDESLPSRREVTGPYENTYDESNIFYRVSNETAHVIKDAGQLSQNIYESAIEGLECRQFVQSPSSFEENFKEELELECACEEQSTSIPVNLHTAYRKDNQQSRDKLQFHEDGVCYSALHGTAPNHPSPSERTSQDYKDPDSETQTTEFQGTFDPPTPTTLPETNQANTLVEREEVDCPCTESIKTAESSNTPTTLPDTYQANTLVEREEVDCDPNLPCTESIKTAESNILVVTPSEDEVEALYDDIAKSIEEKNENMCPTKDDQISLPDHDYETLTAADSFFTCQIDSVASLESVDSGVSLSSSKETAKRESQHSKQDDPKESQNVSPGSENIVVKSKISQRPPYPQPHTSSRKESLKSLPSKSRNVESIEILWKRTGEKGSSLKDSSCILGLSKNKSQNQAADEPEKDYSTLKTSESSVSGRSWVEILRKSDDSLQKQSTAIVDPHNDSRTETTYTLSTQSTHDFSEDGTESVGEFYDAISASPSHMVSTAFETV